MEENRNEEKQEKREKQEKDKKTSSYWVLHLFYFAQRAINTYDLTIILSINYRQYFLAFNFEKYYYKSKVNKSGVLKLGLYSI